jgi:hypothetical protein
MTNNTTQEEKIMTTYLDLSKINVNQHVEKKNGLTYLSWAWAWDTFKKSYPDATYKVVKTTEGLPYFESNAGVMVYTEVTANNLTHEMWLPVMDGANKAMKREAYTYKTKYAEKVCDAFDMFDVNKTIMRCLVKNLAMFGLAIYIYAGEDIPQIEPEPLDLEPLFLAINDSINLDELKATFIAGLKKCGDNKAAQKALEVAKDKRKAELSVMVQS